MEGKGQIGRGVHAGMAVCGGALMLAGLSMPWLSAGVGGKAPTYQGLDLAVISVPTVLFSAGAIGFACAWWHLEDDRFSTCAGVAAGVMFGFAAAMLLAVEGTSALIPASLLPATLRRSSAMLSVGPGVWSALVGSVVVLAAMIGVRIKRFDLGSWATPRGRQKLVGMLLLLALIASLGWLRYQPWIESSVVGQGLDLPGQAAPWVGPISLLALWLLVGALMLVSLSCVQIAGLVAAGAGWLISFLAAVVMVASESLAELRLDDLIQEATTVQGVTFHAAPAVWETFFTGLLAALVGGHLVRRPSHSGGE